MDKVRSGFRGRSRSVVMVAVGLLLLSAVLAMPTGVVADDLQLLPTPAITDLPIVAPDGPPDPMAPDIVSLPTAMPDPPTPEPTPTAAPVPVGVPQRILIPSVGINAAVEIVGLDRDGSLGTPQNFDNTAWYQDSARPGAQGTAVIDGHVDSAVLNRGAVFWNLRYVKTGDIITVISDDGTAHNFSVTSTQQITPETVPETYGPSDGVHLTLITCDSTTPFNRQTHEYGGWVLVTADAM